MMLTDSTHDEGSDAFTMSTSSGDFLLCCTARSSAGPSSIAICLSCSRLVAAFESSFHFFMRSRVILASAFAVRMYVLAVSALIRVGGDVIREAVSVPADLSFSWLAYAAAHAKRATTNSQIA